MKNEIYVSFNMFQFHVNENEKLYDVKHDERYTFFTKLYANKNIRCLHLNEYFNDNFMIRMNENDLNDFIFETNKNMKNDFVFSMYKNDETDVYKMFICNKNEHCDNDQLNECSSFFNVKIDDYFNDNSNCTFFGTKQNLSNFIKYNFGNIELIDKIKKHKTDEMK